MRRPITLALASDVMLGRLVNATIPDRGFAYPWGNVLSVLRRADLFLINLECALTAEAEPWHDGAHKRFYFRGAPALVNTLTAGRVDFASLANNHAGDLGAAGLLETLRVLGGAGIAHAGAGPDLDAARAPARLTSGGWRVSVLAFADHPAQQAATPTAPGINYTPVSLAPEHFTEVTRALTAARRDADLVIFSIHWGPNMRPRPTPAFRAFARSVVSAGADIFWGHSAHLVQGIEFWENRLILYDTGDFVDDYAVDEDLRNDLSALFLVRVQPPAVIDLQLVPVKIENMQVTLADGADRTWFIRRITDLCAEMGTQITASPGALGVTVRARPAGP